METLRIGPGVPQPPRPPQRRRFAARLVDLLAGIGDSLFWAGAGAGLVLAVAAAVR